MTKIYLSYEMLFTMLRIKGLISRGCAASWMAYRLERRRKSYRPLRKVGYMVYSMSDDLDKAIKAAAKASPMDTNKAYAGFFFHRLLCRVFSDPNSSFLLKGGQSMLARTVDARATRDIDLLSEGVDLEQAVEELKRLASIDMGDFVMFTFSQVKSIKDEDEYRAGVCVVFHVRLGNKRLQDVSVDLVADEIPQEGFDTLTPADRIEVRGIPTCDYRIYTVESALADKFCGIVERHDGRSSSRQKDLIDVLIYALSSEIDGAALSRRLQVEQTARKMPRSDRFEIPAEWRESGEARFRKLCGQVPLVKGANGLDDAVKIASKLFNPVLDGSAAGKKWDPASGAWI